jgi:ankyrin repeat protein|tara:strand:+ start:6101 stop:6574 length:474 start_codon:yes stop_codon:yes gene_type:complete
MQPNFLGRSPFFLACQKGNQILLDIFAEQKTEAIVVQDCLGENMLFMCARESKVSIFNWFQGSNNFFRARGQQNYKGQSIEHVVCMEGKTNIVQDIKPKLDTKDYYGNLPIHYTIANDDHQMVLNYFTKGKAYFELRNFKYETIFHIAAKNNSLRSL